MERLEKMQAQLSSQEPNILFELKSGCSKICLNRGKKQNALSTGMHVDLIKTLDRAAESSRLCILKSTTKKVFCAGGDLKNLLDCFKENSVDSACKMFLKIMYKFKTTKSLTKNSIYVCFLSLPELAISFQN